MIVGNPACRSDEWLDLGEHFTEDFVAASIIMRLLPTWTHWMFTNIIPQRWRLRRRLRETRKIVDPAIARHQEASKRRAQGEVVDEEESMLNWLLDNGDKDYVLKNMPILVLVILVPAAHTTAMAISNILFDLCGHPEWDQKLRTEICDVTKEFGPIGQTLPVKDWTSKLEILDSFFNESQRLSQPISSKSANSSSGVLQSHQKCDRCLLLQLHRIGTHMRVSRLKTASQFLKGRWSGLLAFITRLILKSRQTRRFSTQ
jgi:cytochrome P450